MSRTEIHNTIQSGQTVYWKNQNYKVKINKFNGELYLVSGPYVEDTMLAECFVA